MLVQANGLGRMADGSGLGECKRRRLEEAKEERHQEPVQSCELNWGVYELLNKF